MSLQSLLTSGTGLIRKLISKRSFYPEIILNRKIELYGKLSSEVSDRILKEEKQRFECERVIHSLAVERRKLNEEEYSRRRDFLSKRLKEVEGSFLEHDEQINVFRKYGITRTTAGFLIWGGYLAFAAFGWYIGQIIQTLHSSQTGIFSIIINLFARSIQSIVEKLGFGWGFATILIIPLIFIGILCLIIFMSDLILRRFDYNWRVRSEHQKSRKTKGKSTLWTWTTNPTQNIVRSDYTQILAKLPIIYFLSAIPLFIAFLMGLFNKDSISQLQSNMNNPWQSILYTYFGVVLCIIIAGFVFLYCSKIIEPRHKAFYVRFNRNIADIKDGDRKVLSIIKANIEFVIILITFISLFFLFDIIKYIFPSFPTIWGDKSTLAILFLIIITSFVVAYGLMYRGMFRDHNALKNELQAYENEIQRYSAFPVVEISNEEFDRYKDELEKLQTEIDRIWNDDRFWKKTLDASIFLRPYTSILKDIFPDEDEKNIREDDYFNYINADELLEADLVTEINSTIQKIEEVRQGIRNCKKEIEELEIDIEKLHSSVLDEKIKINQKDMNNRKRQYHQTIAQITKDYAKLVSSGDSALKMGFSLRNRIIRNKE